MHTLRQRWDLIPLKEIKQRQPGLLVWKTLISQNKRPFSVPPFVVGLRCFALHSQLGQEKRRWPRRVIPFLWVCVGGNNKAAASTLWLQTNGLMARSNVQSLDIRFRFISALWKTRYEPLLYLCHNDYALWVCDRMKGVCCHPILYICPPSGTQRSLSRYSLSEQKLRPWMSLLKQRCVYKVQVWLGPLPVLSVILHFLLHCPLPSSLWDGLGN